MNSKIQNLFFYLTLIYEDDLVLSLVVYTTVNRHTIMSNDV